MNTPASTYSALCLMICAGCSTTEPLVRTEYIRERPPEELLRACEPPTERPVAITEDIIDNWWPRMPRIRSARLVYSGSRDGTIVRGLDCCQAPPSPPIIKGSAVLAPLF